MREKVIEKTLEEKIIAIVRGMEEDKILPLAEAFYEGGIRMMEVTFNLRQPGSNAATARAIQAVADRFAGDMMIGAGTVVSTELVDIAYKAGALYIVSPGTDVDVIRYTKELGLASMPGALTPTECLTAHNAGADFVKLFPAGEMGPGYIKSIKAPLSHINFLATGGIDEKNIPDFLKVGVSAFGVGGNLVNKAWIEAGEYNKITDLAKLMVEAAKTVI